MTSSLDHTDLVVQTFDKTKGYLVLGSAVRGDAVPVILDHHGELFVGPQALPLQRIAPVPKNVWPTLRLIVPAVQTFPEHVSGIEPLVGSDNRNCDLLRCSSVLGELAAYISGP